MDRISEMGSMEMRQILFRAIESQPQSLQTFVNDELQPIISTRLGLDWCGSRTCREVDSNIEWACGGNAAGC